MEAVVSEMQDPGGPETEGIEFEISELDLSSIEALEGTALGQILQDLYSTGPGITADSSPLGKIFSSFSSFTSFSSHASFTSFSSHSSWSGRAWS